MQRNGAYKDKDILHSSVDTTTSMHESWPEGTDIRLFVTAVTFPRYSHYQAGKTGSATFMKIKVDRIFSKLSFEFQSQRS